MIDWLNFEPLTLRRYDLWVNAVLSYQSLAGLWYLLNAGRLLSLPGSGVKLLALA
ncbi:MAG: hypothetical protein KME50_16230 [Nostoc desertorum CM1-VF14]|nr:hypothetical protein [Nostoc desertorum CM1-VF14]